MKKRKRSARLVDMTRQLLAQPQKVIPLSTFADRYQAAKSSISEDLAIIEEVFREEGYGFLQTVAGAAGGVRYIPHISLEEAEKSIHEICKRLTQPERILPGGYLYMSDILGEPNILHQLGLMFASRFTREVDLCSNSGNERNLARLCDGKFFKRTRCHRTEGQPGNGRIGCQHQLYFRIVQKDPDDVSRPTQPAGGFKSVDY